MATIQPPNLLKLLAGWQTRLLTLDDYGQILHCFLLEVELKRCPFSEFLLMCGPGMLADTASELTGASCHGLAPGSAFTITFPQEMTFAPPTAGYVVARLSGRDSQLMAVGVRRDRVSLRPITSARFIKELLACSLSAWRIIDAVSSTLLARVQEDPEQLATTAERLQTLDQQVATVVRAQQALHAICPPPQPPA